MNLITGGTGLVGAHLLLFLLEKGEKVRAIYRDESSLKKTEKLFKQQAKENLFPQIEWVKADIIDNTFIIVLLLFRFLLRMKKCEKSILKEQPILLIYVLTLRSKSFVM
jgi:nucleoside-diphosphate-sugar epimerase